MQQVGTPEGWQSQILSDCDFLEMIGVCQGHSMKNMAGQLVSPLRSLLFGRFHADSSGARRMGLPPSAFVRDDAMSDYLCSLLMNPYFVVSSPDAWKNYPGISRRSNCFLLMH